MKKNVHSLKEKGCSNWHYPKRVISPRFLSVKIERLKYQKIHIVEW
jgi:hypothetical protein